MPTEKDFKRLVRARMKKTGESYTGARARLLQRRPGRATPSAAATRIQRATAVTADRFELAGMSNAAVRAKTGRTWRRWVQDLDRLGAMRLTHGRIAALARDEFGLSAWWAQTVTVGYERIRGLRAIGQRRGGYEVSKTRTLDVPVEVLYRAFTDARRRRRWLPEPNLAIRVSSPSRSLRIDWGDGTRVQVAFAAKAAGRGQVTIQHSGLRDRESRERLKAFWSERLEALAALARP